MKTCARDGVDGEPAQFPMAAMSRMRPDTSGESTPIAAT
jgi:hypothetical protein